MGLPQKKASEIQSEIVGWDLLDKLPKQVGSFIYQDGSGIQGKILNICSYVNEEQKCRLDITYTDETFDFVPVKTIGLHVFREEKYYSRDKEKFAAMILGNLEEVIKGIDRDYEHSMHWEANSLGFDQWDYWKSLPKTVGDFELYITPDNPVNYINGACIFLEYADFKHNHSLYFSYNYYRDEIYADLIKSNLSITTPAFDVKHKVEDKMKLEVFARLLEEKLIKTLEDLAK